MQQFSWSKGLCIACCSISILVRLATPFPSLVLLLAGNSWVLVEGRRLKDKHYYISECNSCLQLLAIPIIAIVAFSTPYVILKNTAIPPDPVPPGYSSQLWYYLLGYYDYFYHGYPLFQYDAHHLFFLGLNSILILLMVFLMLNRVTVKIALFITIAVFLAWIVGCLIFFGGWIDWIMTPSPITPLVFLCLLPLYWTQSEN